MRGMTRQQQTRRQLGVVSLMVTMIMMIVITLIVLGFAEISRNEQRSSLDDQLSAQAYYAAESGINDVRAVIGTMVAAGAPVQPKPDCSNAGSYASLDPTVGPHGASYTCVIVDPTPGTLVYAIGYSSKVIPIQSASGSKITNLQLSWGISAATDGSATTCYTNAAQLDRLPTADKWNCDYPLVRVDMVAADAGFSRAAWNANTSTMFLMPFSNNGAANVSFPVNGEMVRAHCTAGSCGVTINIPNAAASTLYYMRVTTLYQPDTKLAVTSPGNKFAGAQATIDATGRAEEVLRRVLVAVDLTDANADKTPNGALVVEDSICKRFGTARNYFEVYDTMPGGDNNPFCAPPASYGSPQP